LIYTEPQQARRESFHGVLDYLLHYAGSRERVLFAVPVNLACMDISQAANELTDIGPRMLGHRRQGQRPDKLAFHFIISWHPGDTPTGQHMIETARSALAALGLAEHLAVAVGHLDTEKPHVHVVANVLHPETGRAAKLGWRYRTMSRWAATYEQQQGVIRCPKRRVPKVANENRRRLTRTEWESRQANTKQKADNLPAPRP